MARKALWSSSTAPGFTSTGSRIPTDAGAAARQLSNLGQLPAAAVPAFSEQEQSDAEPSSTMRQGAFHSAAPRRRNYLRPQEMGREQNLANELSRRTLHSRQPVGRPPTENSW